MFSFNYGFEFILSTSHLPLSHKDLPIYNNNNDNLTAADLHTILYPEDKYYFKSIMGFKRDLLVSVKIVNGVMADEKRKR